MALEVKQTEAPDETRPFADRGQVKIVNLDGGPVGKGTFEPGWKWSEHVKPLADTESCEAEHCGYVISGRMKVLMDDGSEGEVGPGDVFRIPPGHDAWTVGDEPCVMVDWAGMGQYAQSNSGI